MLCERLLKMYHQSVMIAEGEASDKQQRKQATAIALRLKAPSEIDLEEYYPAFLDMIRNLLDGERFFPCVMLAVCVHIGFVHYDLALHPLLELNWNFTFQFCVVKN